MRFWITILVLAGLTPLHAQDTLEPASPRPSQPETGVVRVCADPDNLPLSNEKGEGFENAIAELIAKEWKSELRYAWWPVRRGFFSRALNGRYCDIAIQAPGGLDMAAITRPYYRSGYFFVSRKDRGLEDLTSLDDARLKQLAIGVHLLNSDAENTPPAMALSRHGVVGNLKGFSTFYSTDNRPEAIFDALVNKDIDIAIVWGPLAGAYVKQSTTPLALVPLPERDSIVDYPFRFNIAMGVRRRDQSLRDSLDALLAKRAPEIEAILDRYNVPHFPVRDEPAKKRDDGE